MAEEIALQMESELRLENCLYSEQIAVSTEKTCLMSKQSFLAK